MSILAALPLWRRFCRRDLLSLKHAAAFGVGAIANARAMMILADAARRQLPTPTPIDERPKIDVAPTNGNGAWGRIRTTDTRIFSPLLYQLSYPGPGEEGRL